mmetsp:Transcript_16181/g.33203  ORF Transcript_16181/g.33203 Transcript_16181/m.33203 type:complete len:477 (-) Transcript_16181:529-1959(-)
MGRQGSGQSSPCRQTRQKGRRRRSAPTKEGQQGPQDRQEGRNAPGAAVEEVRELRHVVQRRHSPERDDQLLRHLRVLHPEAVELQDMGVHSGLVQRQDQGAGRGERLLPPLRLPGPPREREGPRRGLRPRGRLGHQVRRRHPRQAHRRPPHLRDHHVPRLQRLDQIPPRPPPQAQPVVQRRPLGVQGPHPLPALPRVPLAGGTHGPRILRRRQRHGPAGAGAVPRRLRGPPRRARHPGVQDREGEVRGRVSDHHRRGLHPHVRPSHPGRHVPQPGAELRQDVRHQVPGREGGIPDRVADVLGPHHPNHRGHDHGPRRRQRPRPSPRHRTPSGRHRSHRQQEVHHGAARSLLRQDPRIPQGRGPARQVRRPRNVQPRVEVQPLGAEGRAGPDRGGSPRHGGRAGARRGPSQRREGRLQAGRAGRHGQGDDGRHPGGHVRQGQGHEGRARHQGHQVGGVRPGVGEEQPGPDPLVRRRT